MSVSELEQKMAGELGRAMSLLESRGVPHERARSVDNGILVLDQRYSREVFDLNARIRELEAALRYWLPELNEIDVAAEEYPRWVAAHELLTPSETEAKS